MKGKEGINYHKGDLLGQKINVSIDQDNKNIKNFKIEGNLV